MNRISVQMTVSLPPALYDKAMAVAKEEVRSKSDLVREALRGYILKKERIGQIRKKLAANLKKNGIQTLQDIERMIDEERV